MLPAASHHDHVGWAACRLGGGGACSGGLALGMLSCRKFFSVSVTPPSEMADASSSACAQSTLHVYVAHAAQATELLSGCQAAL